MVRYNAYLPLIWHDERPAGARWVARLEHIEDGAVVRFDDRAALLAYLAAAIEIASGAAHWAEWASSVGWIGCSRFARAGA